MAEKNKKKSSFIPNFYDFVEIIVQALVIIFIIFTLCFRVSGVVGDSMNPTLNSGDWLFNNEVLSMVFSSNHDANILYGDVMYHWPDKRGLELEKKPEGHLFK